MDPNTAITLFQCMLGVFILFLFSLVKSMDVIDIDTLTNTEFLMKKRRIDENNNELRIIIGVAAIAIIVLFFV